MSKDLPKMRLARELDRRGVSLDRVMITDAEMADIVKDRPFTPSQLREGEDVGDWGVDEVVAGLIVGFKRRGSPARDATADKTELEALFQERQERS